MIKLIDVVQINPDIDLAKLSKSEKHKLMDAALQDAVSESSRGLNIKFGLSHSGRRINNRIYTPRGHRAGVSSWTEPYPKPIILNHDKKGDPLGRFVSVEWVSTKDRALPYFKDVRGFMQLQDAFDADDPKRIYKTLKRFNLLTNKEWPGLGQLLANARITDEAAVEKFLDGRYLTFSAGSHTDRYMCGICGDDWAQGEFCDHRPGEITSDGDIGTFITGSFLGDEGSVVNVPADNLGQLLSMQMTDSVDFNKLVSVDSRRLDTSTVYLTDAKFSTGELTMLTPSEEEVPEAIQTLQSMDARDIARALIDGKLEQTLLDALEGSNHFEISWLVKVHDALHHAYDWKVRYASEEEATIPMAVFKFHGDLHELSLTKEFRDSFLNGPLDKFDALGAASETYVMKAPESEDVQTEQLVIQDREELVTEVKRAVLAVLNPVQEPVVEPAETLTETTDGVQETKKDEAQDEAQEIVDDIEVDWQILDLALQGELLRMADENTSFKDAKLSTKAREKLDAKAFCGPDRSFPIPDCAHVTAGRRLIGRAKLSDAQKAKVLACIDRKAKSMGCDDQKDSNCNCKTTQQDYIQALQTIDILKAEIQTLTTKLEDSGTSRDTIQEVTIRDIQSVEDPSIDSSDVSAPSASSVSKQFDAFTAKILKRYKNILNKDGEEAAMHYIKRYKQRGYIAQNFDPTKLIEES